MFTGIIEQLGTISAIKSDKSNLHLTITSKLAPELQVDQSIAHNGVCLTVVTLNDHNYTVTAIKETLEKTNLGALKLGDIINLERGIKLGARLDGHIVQGHIDQTAVCKYVAENNGSWVFTFEYDSAKGNVTIEKGSITVNGVSLTVFNSEKNAFSVAIIPYTYQNTTFKTLQVGDVVNLEFDVIGKYVAKLLSNSNAYKKP